MLTIIDYGLGMRPGDVLHGATLSGMGGGSKWELGDFRGKVLRVTC